MNTIYFFNLYTLTSWHDTLIHLLLFLQWFFLKGKNNKNKDNNQHLCVRNCIKHLSDKIVKTIEWGDGIIIPILQIRFGNCLHQAYYQSIGEG